MKKLALICVLALTAFGAAFAQSDLQPIAIIKLNKSETLTVKQLKARVSVFEKQMGRSLTVEERKQALTSLIEEKLLLQAATKDGITVADSAVDQMFVQMMSQQVGAQLSEKELDEVVRKQQGISLDELLIHNTGLNVAGYKNYIKESYISRQYIAKLKQAELQAVAPTDEEIRNFYESNKKSFVWNDMLKILVVVVAKGDNIDAARNKANDLRNKISDKKLTAEQAIVQANASGSGYQAGYALLEKSEDFAMRIGYSMDELRKLFDATEGFISDLHETTNDFRFIVTEKKYAAKMLSLSDVVQPESTITVYEYIRSNLGQQKQQSFLQYAAAEVSKSLNTPENVEMKKSGDALDKLLSWEN